LVNAGAHFQPIQVLRCDSKPRSAEKSRDVKNGTILEKSRGMLLGPICQTPLYILEDVDGSQEPVYNQCRFIILKIIYLCFYLYFYDVQYTSYDYTSKLEKNDFFIEEKSIFLEN
jgi:hypothetical protein